jgi:hypothetical protein
MVPEGAEPRPGERISVVCEPDRTLLYDGESGELLDGSTAAEGPAGGAAGAVMERPAAVEHPGSQPVPVERRR